jgi:tripartite-type tricarboxylate transporter receptor subunit TctC
MSSVALLTAAFVGIAPAAHADDVADFYKGKVVRLLVGDPAGSGYDVIGRLLSRHLGKHIPGSPTIVVENMEGGAGLKVVNYVYGDAAKDGLTIGAIHRAASLAPLFGTADAQFVKFDAQKFGWIGSIDSTVTVAAAWAASGITTFDQLRTKETVVASDAPSSDSYVFSHLLNKMLGTKLKIVVGYAGTNNSYLAMEKGEVTAYMGSSYSSYRATKPDWIRDHKINFLIQISVAKDPRLPDVPLVTDYANEKQKQALKLILAPQQMARPFVTTPGVDPARLKALQAAFMATMKDPEFVEDANKLSVDIDPMDGPAVADLVASLYKSPPDIVKLANETLEVTP